MKEVRRWLNETGDAINFQPGDRMWTRRGFVQWAVWIAGSSGAISSIPRLAMGASFQADAFESEFPSMGSKIELRWVSAKGMDPKSV